MPRAGAGGWQGGPRSPGQALIFEGSSTDLGIWLSVLVSDTTDCSLPLDCWREPTPDPKQGTQGQSSGEGLRVLRSQGDRRAATPLTPPASHLGGSQSSQEPGCHRRCQGQAGQREGVMAPKRASLKEASASAGPPVPLPVGARGWRSCGLGEQEQVQLAALPSPPLSPTPPTTPPRPSPRRSRYREKLRAPLAARDPALPC